MPNINYPDKKYNITGGGIAGYVLALLLHLDAQQKGERIRITINDQLSDLEATPAANLFLSFTHVEMKAVLPPIKVLLDAANKPFDKGGIRVDVDGVNDSQITRKFLDSVAQLAQEPAEITQKREDTLTDMGKMSMEMWDMLANLNPKLKSIFEKASYHPCRNPQKEGDPLFNQGYRADLLFDMEPGVAATTVEEMCATFTKDGYTHTKPLSPDELEYHVPALVNFCDENSEVNAQNQRVWKNSAAAILRPGGSINAAEFLRGLQRYLEEEMGTYINEKNKEHHCFRTHYDRRVTALIRDEETLEGLVWENQKNEQHVRRDKQKHEYKEVEHFFCPGGNVATLPALGLPVPPSMGFAGVSLTFEIHDLPDELFDKYSNMDFGGEFHSTSVVLAVQARANGRSMLVGAAGTKSLHGDVMPDPKGVFARNRALLQLNAANKVFPDLFGHALHKDTKGKTLTFDDLDTLIANGHVKVKALVRAVACHGFSTQGTVAPNAYVMTNGGSGTGSCAPAMAATLLSRMGMFPLPIDKEKAAQVMTFANPVSML